MEGKNKAEKLLGNVREYAETCLNMVSLNIQDKVSDVLASVASVIVIALFAIFILFFSSIGTAWWIGKYLNNPSIGFFCVAGFYLVATIVLILNRDRWIKIPVINALIKKININEED